MSRLPKLTYEEYEFAATHFLLRIQSLLDAGTLAVDQFVLKWFLLRVLKTPPHRKPLLQALHVKFFGAIQKLIHDNLIAVVRTVTVGSTAFRVLALHPLACPSAAFIALRLKEESKKQRKTTTPSCATAETSTAQPQPPLPAAVEDASATSNSAGPVRTSTGMVDP